VTCARCGRPIDPMEPHLRIAERDQDGQPIAGRFKAYHLECEKEAA
jgi:hypothetical protein